MSANKQKLIVLIEVDMAEIKQDCHYCEFAMCQDDKSDVDCYVEDFAYFDHHVEDSTEAIDCEWFEYCDVFPKF